MEVIDRLAAFFQGWVFWCFIIFLLFYLIMNVLAPFFWFGTNKRAREISEKLDVLIDLQMQRLDTERKAHSQNSNAESGPDRKARDAWIKG
ncbi:MAG: hypothetical protein AAF662_10080 [Pseudomonadota bacterium]